MPSTVAAVELLTNTRTDATRPATASGGPPSAGRQCFQRVDQLAHRSVGEPSDRSVHVTDHPTAVDDEHAAPREAERPERAIAAGDGLVGVGQQRELEAVLAGELVVALHALRGDAQHLSVERLELGEVVVVAVQLLGAHRRVVARVEDQHHWLAGIVAERHLSPPTGRQGERRRPLSGTEAHDTVSISSSLMSKFPYTSCTSSLSSSASMIRSTLRASSASLTSIVVLDTIVLSADSTPSPAASRAS